jgi:hypothetical protein
MFPQMKGLSNKCLGVHISTPSCYCSFLLGIISQYRCVLSPHKYLLALLIGKISNIFTNERALLPLHLLWRQNVSFSFIFWLV